MIIDVHAHAISGELADEMTADSPIRSPAFCLPFFSTWKDGSGASRKGGSAFN